MAHQMESIITSIQKGDKNLDNETIQLLIEHLELIKLAILRVTSEDINQETKQQIDQEEEEQSDDFLSDEMKEIYANETQEHIK